MKPHFLKRIFSRRSLARLVFTLVVLVTLVMIFHRVEASRGLRAWDTYRKSAETRGVQFWLRDFVEPPIPDAENFAAIPYFKGQFGNAAEKKAAAELLPSLSPKGLKRPLYGSSLGDKMANLTEWRDFFVKSKVIATPSNDAARDLITMLQNVPGLQQIRAAAGRPKAVFPTDIEKGFAAEFPHLGATQAATNLFFLECDARIAIGDGASALDAIKYAFRLADAMRDKPYLIAFLIRMSALERAENSIRYGITRGVWSDSQLTALDEILAGQNLIPGFRFAMALERAAMTTEFERLASSSAQNASEGWKTIGISPLMGYTYPRGWFYLNMVKANELYDRILAKYAPVNGREPEFIASEADGGVERVLAGLTGIDSYRYLFVKLIMPAIGSVESLVLLGQTRINQSRIGIALERTALASGGYPDTLESLPSFTIPKDPCDGQPMRYRRLENGYELWSVAKDRVDEKGRKDPAISSPRDQPDWVWKIVKSPAAAKP